MTEAHASNPPRSLAEQGAVFARACARSGISADDFRERLSKLLVPIRDHLVGRIPQDDQHLEVLRVRLTEFAAAAWGEFARLRPAAVLPKVARVLH